MAHRIQPQRQLIIVPDGDLTLAERRIVSEFETGPYPALKTRVEEAAGFPVPMEVHWDTLAVPGESRLYAESWPSVYFEPLIAGLAAVCRDEMGREALKGALKKIVIQNTKSCVYGDCWATLADGVLTLDHESLTNSGAIQERTNGLVTVLESNL
jgi:hypothetical protein